jgi:hypothetical protein
MLADRNAMPFLEVSAKTGDNIQECFTTLGKDMLASIKNNEIALLKRDFGLRKDAGAEEDSGRECAC